MNRADLVSIADLLKPALATNNTVPVFQYYTFKDNAVSAYNDLIGIEASCDAETPFAVEGKVLHGLLSNARGEEADIEVKENEVEIKVGRSLFKLPYLSEDKFLFEKTDKKWTVKLPIDNLLLRGFSACLLTASKELTQERLMGVVIRSKNARNYLYSCDGDAVTRCDLGKSKTLEFEYKLPNEFCDAVLNVVKGSAADGGTLHLNEEWAMAQLNTGYLIYGRLQADGADFDHEKLIKDTLPKQVIYVKVPEGLNGALNRARVVADAESSPTTLTVEGSRLKLITDTNSGVVKDNVLFKHTETKAKVSAGLLQRSINICDTIFISEGCCAFRNEEGIFQLLSNM